MSELLPVHGFDPCLESGSGWMNIAAILLAFGTSPGISQKWVIQSGIVGKRYVVRVTGKKCGRARYVEARHFLGTWRCHARKFEDPADAEAFANSLKPAEAQKIEVTEFENAWHEEVLDDRWRSWPKIAPPTAGHDRPLLELVRLYAAALESKLSLRHIIPAVLAFIEPTKAVDTGLPGGAEVVESGGANVKLEAWRERLQTRGLSTVVLMIEAGTAAEKIINQTQELGSRVIAIGAQHGNQNDLLGGFLRDPSTQVLLHEAPCPILIAETTQVILT